MSLEKLEKCNLCQSGDIVTIDEKCNICQCRCCGYIFDNPRPTHDELANYYSQALRYDECLGENKAWDMLWERRLKLVKREKTSGTLLDVGAGIGQFLYLAQDGFKVKGTEVCDSAVRLAREKYNIDLISGSLEDINFEDTKFDVITLFHVLEHVPNPSQTIEKCKALLSEKGILIIAVPNDASSFTIRFFVIRLLSILKIGKFKVYGKLALPKLESGATVPIEMHLSHFTPSVLEQAFRSSGFTIIRNTLDPYYAVKGIKKIVHDFVYYFCIIINKLFGKNIYATIWISARVKE